MAHEEENGQELDLAEWDNLCSQLSSWSSSGVHHLHKRWQFDTAQQALRWYGQARAISARHGRHCDFYLGSVGEGRIDTDILNRERGSLNQEDLELARSLDALACDPQAASTDQGETSEH